MLGLVIVSPLVPIATGFYFLLAAIGGLRFIFPTYALFILAIAFVERRILIPPMATGEAVRRAQILAFPAFGALAWLGLASMAQDPLTHPAVLGPILFLGYAHGARLVAKTGRGVRHLGAGAIALGVSVLGSVVATAFWRFSDEVCSALEMVTFPGARLCMGIYGGILAWNGYWLLRARQDKA